MIEVLGCPGSLVGKVKKKVREQMRDICWILFQRVTEQVVRELENEDLGELFQSSQMEMGWNQGCGKTPLQLPHYFHLLYWYSLHCCFHQLCLHLPLNAEVQESVLRQHSPWTGFQLLLVMEAVSHNLNLYHILILLKTTGFPDYHILLLLQRSSLKADHVFVEN